MTRLSIAAKFNTAIRIIGNIIMTLRRWSLTIIAAVIIYYYQAQNVTLSNDQLLIIVLSLVVIHLDSERALLKREVNGLWEKITT